MLFVPRGALLVAPEDNVPAGGRGWQPPAGGDGGPGSEPGSGGGAAAADYDEARRRLDALCRRPA